MSPSSFADLFRTYSNFDDLRWSYDQDTRTVSVSSSSDDSSWLNLDLLRRACDRYVDGVTYSQMAYRPAKAPFAEAGASRNAPKAEEVVVSEQEHKDILGATCR